MSPSAGAPDSVSTRNSLPSRSRTNGVEHCGFAQWLSIRGSAKTFLLAVHAEYQTGFQCFVPIPSIGDGNLNGYCRRVFGTIADMSSVVA